MCVHLIRHYSNLSFQAPRLSGALSPRRAKTVVYYIEDNLESPILLEDLVRMAGTSTFHFVRQFRVRFGQSPHVYLIERRLDRARVLILKAGVPLKEIASRCGFCDQSHMTRLFKQRFRVTPKALQVSARH